MDGKRLVGSSSSGGGLGGVGNSPRKKSASKPESDVIMSASSSVASTAAKLHNVVFVLGPPGCGKGTQCARIQKVPRFCPFHTLSSAHTVVCALSVRFSGSLSCFALMVSGRFRVCSDS
ncbi:unnamed protein product [Anisakis simplex]|uniref:Adenylate kinase n=1 Tax=Anisakis simplex TaxID=6269 RepID=A0A0M3KI14_ANISI|nr:unnamed protein product [Anisakis simplex]